MFKKRTTFQSLKAKTELSVINEVDESDAVNPFISTSDEEDANEEINVIEYEPNEEIIM